MYMTAKFVGMNEQHIKDLFKTHHYQCVPVEYISFIKIKYDNNIVKRYNRAQISNRINELNTSYAKIYNLYDDANVSEMQIELRYDKLANDVNETLGSWFTEIITQIKNEE